MNGFNRLGAVALVGVAVAWSGPSASQVLEFDDSVVTQTGTLSYDGILGSSLIGTDILFDSIQGTNTPLNDGVQIACTGCKLNFTTAASIQNGSAGGDDWLFGVGGTFELIGDVAAAGIVNDTILVGTFLGSDFGGSLFPAGGGTGLLVSEGFDVKNEKLLDYYGLPDELFVFVNSEISVTGCTFSGAAFDCDVQNADIVNAALVPAPASLALIGLGLVGIGAARRRSRRS